MVSHQVQYHLSGIQKKKRSWVRRLGHQHTKIKWSTISIHVAESPTWQYLYVSTIS